MNAAVSLHEFGQSLWLDNISRSLLEEGTLSAYIKNDAITGLTSNPTIFEHSIRNTDCYDADILEKASAGIMGEDLFFDMAMQDICQAADLFLPAHVKSSGEDGWVSLEVSPLLANLSPATVREARKLHQVAHRRNLLIKIPGTPLGLSAVRETISEGVPVNVTLLFSTEQYLAAAGAYMTGIESRISRGLNPVVHSVASIFVSRWDNAVRSHVAAELQNQLGIAMAHSIYSAYRAMLVSPRWRILEKAGAKHQRLLWASTATKDPAASDTLYLQALAAPDTIITIPEQTLLAYVDHGRLNGSMLVDDDESDQIIARFVSKGFNMRALAVQLQHEGIDSFTKSWYALMVLISQKSTRLARNARME